MSFCGLSISCFSWVFGISEVASAIGALVDVWDVDNLYRIVGFVVWFGCFCF